MNIYICYDLHDYRKRQQKALYDLQRLRHYAISYNALRAMNNLVDISEGREPTFPMLKYDK